MLFYLLFTFAEKVGAFLLPDFAQQAAKHRGISQKDANFIQENISKDITLQKDVILRTKNPYTGSPLSSQAQLEARTIPNARLVKAFGVNNAFTTQDMKISVAFKSLAKSLLRNAIHIKKKVDETGKPTTEDSDAQWEHIICTVQKIVTHEISNGQNNIMNLIEVVQLITLEMSMQCLFGTTVNTEEKRDGVIYIAKTINILWMQSKNKTTSISSSDKDETDWTQERHLHSLLYDLTNLEPTDPLLNPMNLILPAYETMWRAVLRGILELLFRTHPNSHLWRETLRSFKTCPQRETFHRFDTADNLCPLDIVKEILRLYPPTRRIHRHFPDDPATTIRTADIEKLHRNVLLCPEGDAHLFRPERWLQIKKDFTAIQIQREETLKKTTDNPNAKYTLRDYEEDLGYMPFGLSCPAGGKVTQGFRFKMIAVLVSAIVDGLESLDEEFTGSDVTVTEVGVIEDENMHDAPGTTGAEAVLISLEEDAQEGDEVSSNKPDGCGDGVTLTPLTFEALRQLDDTNQDTNDTVTDKDSNIKKISEVKKDSIEEYITNTKTGTEAWSKECAARKEAENKSAGDVNLNTDTNEKGKGKAVDDANTNTDANAIPDKSPVDLPLDIPKPEPIPRLQKWRLYAESPRDEVPPIEKTLGSERDDYLSLVYRRVV